MIPFIKLFEAAAWVFDKASGPVSVIIDADFVAPCSDGVLRIFMMPKARVEMNPLHAYAKWHPGATRKTRQGEQ